MAGEGASVFQRNKHQTAEHVLPVSSPREGRLFPSDKREETVSAHQEVRVQDPQAHIPHVLNQTLGSALSL